jgi:pimeloyl-ACP methyl ester carboxylesterase
MARSGRHSYGGASWLSRFLRLLLATSSAGLAALLAAASYFWVKPPRLPFRETVPEDISPEEVYFPSRDGLRLHGLYLVGRPGSPGLLLCHGYYRSLAEPFPLGCELNRLGYHVLLIDFRGCGLSGGRFTTVGYREAADVLGAVDYLRQRLGQGPLGVLGISMGAVAALRAAPDCSAIAAVVADSAYADLEATIRHKMEEILRLSFLVGLGWAAIRIGERLSGGNVAAVRAVDAAARLNPRPLLLIYGERDDYLPPDNAQRLFEAAGEPKELWVAPGSGHAMARLDHGREYVERVHAFFQRCLMPVASGANPTEAPSVEEARQVNSS